LPVGEAEVVLALKPVAPTFARIGAACAQTSNIWRGGAMIGSIESIAPKMILSLFPASIQTPKSLNGGDLLSARKSGVTISIGKSRKRSYRGHQKEQRDRIEA
jgi:hypothetical protein